MRNGIMLKITGYRLSKISIPLAKPFVTSLRRVEAAEALLLELREASGVCGLGEAPGSFAITKESLEDIADTIEKKIMPALLHRSFGTLPEALEALLGSCEGHGSAKAAADIALHDLWPRWGGDEPPYLAGGEVEAVTDVTISLGRPEAMAAEALEAIGKGCDILKVKLGGGEGLDTERVKAVREAAPSARLLVDANQAWSEEEALRIIEEISPLGIELVEQPLLADDLDGMRRVTQKSAVSILADESIFTLEDAKRVIGEGCADMVNVKLMKCGGLFRAAEILAWCDSNGVECMVGSMLETPRSIAAAMRLAKRYENCVRYLDLDSPLLYERLPESAPVEMTGNRLKLKRARCIT